MLRIHFTGDDLARTRIASSPDPLWETVLSWHMIRLRSTDPSLRHWKRQVLAGLKPGDPARAEVAPLLAVNRSSMSETRPSPSGALAASSASRSPFTASASRASADAASRNAGVRAAKSV